MFIMPFQVGNGCISAAISSRCIKDIASSDTSPHLSVWDKIKAFFCSTKKPEVLELIRQICHPPAGTTLEQVAGRFEQLRTFAFSGFAENVQFGRHGEKHFCILDENSQEMLSVTIDDAGKYTVKCQEHHETHHLTPDAERGEECPEHATATTAPQTLEEYEVVWSEWKKAAPSAETHDRAFVVDVLRDIHIHDTCILHLNRRSISSLPPCIEIIEINDTLVASLSALPNGVRYLSVSNTPLTSLSALPDSLDTIYINNTQLTELPKLPDNLFKLVINDALLTELPELPGRLNYLSIYIPSLTNLPKLPDSLTSLQITGTLLTELPELSGGLRELRIEIPTLTNLPELPDRLRTMVVQNTSITSLPESITRLPSDARIYIANTPLSEHTRQTLETMTSSRGYSGPRINFNMAAPSTPQEARPLHQAVADWLAPAKEGEPAPDDRWQSFGQEHDATSFSAFLDRLGETKNCKKKTSFKAQISTWLTQLAEDGELRAKTFAMATEATSSCEDRVTLALNQMKNLQLVHDAEKGKYDNNRPELVSVGREMFRLEKLVEIAWAKVNKLFFVDEIEVYLGFQNKLKEVLELSSVTKEMRFFDVSHITESDLQAAEIQVKTSENTQFREWILQWAPLRSVLKRAYPEDWETLCKKKISDYDDIFQMLSDTELKPAELVGNTDAERAVGTRAMESTEQAFLQGLSPLADRMLGEHLKARWS
ncbi:NEL-type E3 ubiquitin ligase domain-containing protein [Enterobacter sp. 22466]|uniref:NEL-type E3 ubiquitin ligase domain-containing protein n=1 Tax=Enterobacter sp. 22466 TaxID=3453924 RepID=UPI003F87E6B5